MITNKLSKRRKSKGLKKKDLDEKEIFRLFKINMMTQRHTKIHSTTIKSKAQEELATAQLEGQSGSHHQTNW